jgi:hypothetical protein
VEGGGWRVEGPVERGGSSEGRRVERGRSDTKTTLYKCPDDWPTMIYLEGAGNYKTSGE